MERLPAEHQKRRKKSQSGDAQRDEMDDEDVELFQVVVEDLRRNSTVGWQNAVKSLTAALTHIEREESLRFLDFAFARIVSIMLDQYPSKIGQFEKSCVTQTLSVAVPIIVAQLKSGRYILALSVLVMVFNKKRWFYKEQRGSTMTGNYWNRAAGAPEVRTQCIAAFCELKGFHLLLETLETMMKSLQMAVDEGRKPEEMPEMIESDDIRILLQALLECRNSVPDAVTSRICVMIMTYYVKLPEAILKRESTDAVGAVVALVRRFVDGGAGNASTINTLWLELTHREMESTSLPLRLFGLEQISQIVNCARASRAVPPRYLVRNAGTKNVNGIYTLKPDAANATYVFHRDDTNQDFTLFCCTMKSGLKWWFISEADKMQPGSDQDIDYYQHQSQFEEYLPPTHNWMAIGRGEAPAPELIPEIVHDDSGEDDETRSDNILTKWVREKHILDAIFGDKIHREVVSRSLVLIKFLAESDKLTTEDLDTIWASCLQKDQTLAEEIYGLLIASIPILSDQLIVHLVQSLHAAFREKHSSNESFPELIAFLQRLGRSSPGFLMERSLAVTDAILRLLWTIQVTSEIDNIQLSKDLREFFLDGLRSEYGDALRRVFIKECMDGIKRLLNPSEILDSGIDSGEPALAVSGSHEFVKFLVDSYEDELASVVESLDEEYSMVALLFDELAAFVTRSTEKSSSLYRREVEHRLDLIHYVHVKSHRLVLTVQQVERLWTTLSGSPMERELCLVFFAQSSLHHPEQTVVSSTSPAISSAFTDEVRQYIFDELLCRQTDFKSLSTMGYRCFNTYFVAVNTNDMPSPGSASNLQNLLGLDAVWRIAFEAPIEVSELASRELFRVYAGEGEIERSRAVGKVEDFLRRVFGQLSLVSGTTTDEEKLVQRCTNLLHGVVDGANKREDAQSIKRGKSHGRSGRGTEFQVKVIAQRIPGASAASSPASADNTIRTTSTGVFANQTMLQLRKQLEGLVGHPMEQTKILCAGAALTGDHKTVTELRISEMSELRVLLFNTVVQRSMSPGFDDLMDDVSEDVSISPGEVIAGNEQYFDVLFHVSDIFASHDTIHASLWAFLQKIPTNEQLLEKIMSFGEGSLQDDDGDSTMSTAGETVTTLRSRWNSLLHDASRHKAAYILQIIDALLLPSDPEKSPSARSYQKHFVLSDGFDEVLQYFLGVDVDARSFNEGIAVALRILQLCAFTYSTACATETLDEGSDELATSRVSVTQSEYEGVAKKIAELVVAEYRSEDAATGDKVHTDSPRITVEALKAIRSMVTMGTHVADAYLSCEGFRAVAVSALMECANDQLREQWLVSLQSVCQASKSTTPVIFERVIDSFGAIEDVAVACDQYFRLVRFLVQEDEVRSHCKVFANLIVEKLRAGFSTKFLASNEHSNDVVIGLLESLRDVLVHQTELRADLAEPIVQAVFEDCLFTLPVSSYRRRPLCVSTETRRPAFKLLATAISSHAEILHRLYDRLSELFHRNEGLQQKWGQEVNGEMRGNGEYVGLKNMGCSCYINSFLQQIFMQPTFRQGILAAQLPSRPSAPEPTKADVQQEPQRLVGFRIAMECVGGRVYEATVVGYDATSGRHQFRYDDGSEASFVLTEGRPGNENGRYAILHAELSGAEATMEVLRQVQRTFCYLRDSEMRYYNPKALIDACKCLNLEFSVYQQNDASEFCDKLLDRLETALKSTPQGTKCLNHTFGGKQIAQNIPQECKHRNEKEDPFIRVPLEIRGKESIEESLASYVEGELMHGDNKVTCDECETKRVTLRRIVLGDLPNMLIVHLKRFDYNFMTNETVKLNSRCSFPMLLNMKPYTKAGLEEQEGVVSADQAQDEDTEMDTGESFEYRLKGVLVHSGVAQGGHYYSFIFDHVLGKWFKFDDEEVSLFDPSNIEAECFGGVQKRTWHGTNSSMEMEVFSNALMLFYEKIEPVDTEYADALVKEAPHVHPEYETEVWKANEAFLQNSYLFDVEFHEFLREMVQSKYLKDSTASSTDTPGEQSELNGHSVVPPAAPLALDADKRSDEAIQAALAQIGAEFVLSVLLHSREKHGIARWITVLASKFVKYKSICVRFFDELSSSKRVAWLRRLVFESPDSIARQSFVHLVSRALTAYESHLKNDRSSVDEEILLRFLSGIVEFLGQTPVQQQTHLEECFMLIRNCADLSPTLRDGMQKGDMVARLVNCFLGERSPEAVKQAFPLAHTNRSAGRFASPDYQYLLEAIIAILGLPRRTSEPLVKETSTQYPHRVILSDRAERVLTEIYEQFQSGESMNSEELRKYLSVCMGCSINATAAEQKSNAILAKYGAQITPSSLYLDGFLAYYADLASSSPKNVYQDLRAHGYGEDLKRRDSGAEHSGGVVDVLNHLSRDALLSEVFFDSALEEDAETVGDLLLRISVGSRDSSLTLLRSILLCMNSTETGWKGQPVVDTCSHTLQALLSHDAEYLSELVEFAMTNPDYGLITTADSREKLRQRYMNSNHVPLFIYRQIVVLLDLHAKIPTAASWLASHRELWEWMYEWLRLESLKPSLGGRLAVLFREPAKLETLQRLGDILGITYCEEERVYIVEGAGFEHVNGLYKSTAQTHDNCPIYSCEKEAIDYTLFRCRMPSKARRWYISYSPNKSLLGTVSDEDYYFVACHLEDDAPPESGWKVWTKNEKAQAPAPTVRLFSSTVASDSSNRMSSMSEDFGHGDIDCGDGDGDADADTVEYDDSEDEIRVSNERFQAVHLDNQDDGDGLSSSTDDFM
ncbi:hypothetical protein Poli38472_005688 [Pythium oligandrum]|uniref:ubiquitinyl hydrolase 1 n=1 Tax=Pythium oligandrum TaxID=41045 RepID=A0A8K1CH08_PYTOL|nr:hypothetical protein Poli38472_005688 [Pythium oligandrum]|eukprot:TMW63070.1 hypothetical protein Poli38472_005688 [Pythium oligandrum]